MLYFISRTSWLVVIVKTFARERFLFYEFLTEMITKNISYLISVYGYTATVSMTSMTTGQRDHQPVRKETNQNQPWTSVKLLVNCVLWLLKNQFCSLPSRKQTPVFSRFFFMLNICSDMRTITLPVQFTEV